MWTGSSERAQPRPLPSQKKMDELGILQSRSPSCGVKEIYDGTFSGTKIPGQGVFAKMLMDEGIRVLDAGELPKIILKNEDGKCQSD